MDVEKWKAVAGWPGYEVSNLGQVRRLPRYDALGRKYPARIHCGCRMHDGYVGAMLKDRARTQLAYVHRLVLTAFDRPPEAHEVCRHLDGDPANNWIGNLAWGTQAENIQDAVEAGKFPKGSKHWLSCLTEKQIEEIRSSTESTSFLASKYKVSLRTIRRRRAEK